MNFFDHSILSFLNQFSQNSPLFDHLIDFLENTNLFKAAIFLAFFWAWWLQPSPDLLRRRKIILSTLTGCAFAIFIARMMALCLPFRQRPLNESAIQFLHPLGISQHTLEKWSSFPSDHAALFLGLTTGCFLINRRYGICAAIYTLFFVLFPRIYLGFHYPTDILIGGVIGWIAVWIFNRSFLQEKVARLGFAWLEAFPVAFYVCFFLATYQFVVLFDDIREVGHFAIEIKHYLRNGHAWPES